MKIPETSANIGAYYGTEENGHWQPNGVMMDNGVGGGVVGSGDAGVHRPMYPIHMPRGHIPGYVMAGAYYPPGPYPAVAVPQDDFADYMWMENEEEFDKQVMQQLEEEALMEQCIEAMLEDEQRERHRPPVSNGHRHYPVARNGGLSLEEAVSRSTLNPLAAEFVPTFSRGAPNATEGRGQGVPAPVSEVPPKEDTVGDSEMADSTRTSSESPPLLQDCVDGTETEESAPSTVVPEVSAAEVQPVLERRVEDQKTPDTACTQDQSKAPPKAPKTSLQADKSTKVDGRAQSKKKEAKTSKSESQEDSVKTVSVAAASEQPKQKSAAAVEPTTVAPKPINYAAAAKLNKPKAAVPAPTPTPTPAPIPAPHQAPKAKSTPPAPKRGEKPGAKRAK